MLGPFFKVSCNGPDCQSELRVSAKVGDSPRSMAEKVRDLLSEAGWTKGRPRNRSLSGVFTDASGAKGNTTRTAWFRERGGSAGTVSSGEISSDFVDARPAFGAVTRYSPGAFARGLGTMWASS